MVLSMAVPQIAIFGGICTGVGYKFLDTTPTNKYEINCGSSEIVNGIVIAVVVVLACSLNGSCSALLLLLLFSVQF